ncbi:MAG: enoyl-CoA hydratase/isomerase family protein [Steroidobacteraceae bacterium]
MNSKRQPLDAQQLLVDLAKLGGSGLRVHEFDAGPAKPVEGPGVVRLGVHRTRALPHVSADDFDILLTPQPAPAPWVSVSAGRMDEVIMHLHGVVQTQPAAVAAAAQVLRMTLAIPFEDAQCLESLAYSMLLASRSFRAWRAATPIRTVADEDSPRVLLSRANGVLHIRLNRPNARNAVDARMRDSLVEALQFALDDPDRAPVLLTGAGPSFCSGGDLNEFGQADDPGVAHLIRVLRVPARLVDRLRDRIRVHVHGACVGAGIEMPAAAGWITATPDALFRLPEVAMGLIPGAGGTATIPRRIGRHRACYMALTGYDIDAHTALSWGLIDALEPA